MCLVSLIDGSCRFDYILIKHCKLVLLFRPRIVKSNLLSAYVIRLPIGKLFLKYLNKSIEYKELKIYLH